MTQRIIPIPGQSLLLRDMNLAPLKVIEWSPKFVEALIGQGEKRATKKLVAVLQDDTITEKRPTVKREQPAMK